MISIDYAIGYLETRLILWEGGLYQKKNEKYGEILGIAIDAIKEKKHNDELRLQGRLVEFPCAVNDTVYTLVSTESGYIIKKTQVKEIQLKHRPFGDSVFMLEQVGRRGLLFKYYESDFGKSVFPTNEAAEVALMEKEAMRND